MPPSNPHHPRARRARSPKPQASSPPCSSHGPNRNHNHNYNHNHHRVRSPFPSLVRLLARTLLDHSPIQFPSPSSSPHPPPTTDSAPSPRTRSLPRHESSSTSISSHETCELLSTLATGTAAFLFRRHLRSRKAKSKSKSKSRQATLSRQVHDSTGVGGASPPHSPTPEMIDQALALVATELDSLTVEVALLATADRGKYGGKVERVRDRLGGLRASVNDLRILSGGGRDRRERRRSRYIHS